MPRSTDEHFFPQADGDFMARAERFNVYVQLNFLTIGLKLADATGVNSALFRFRIGYLAHVQARAAERGLDKEDARALHRAIRAVPKSMADFTNYQLPATTEPAPRRSRLG